MKKILFALIGIVGIIVLAITVLVFVMPTDFKVEREVEINKPRAEVFSYVKLLKNQNEWGPWIKKDPNQKLSSTGTDGEVGFITKWDSESEEVGKGEQEIIKIVDGERIDSELRFKAPFDSKADAFMILEDSGSDKTKVKWGFTGSFPRPMNLMLLVMDMDAEIGKDFDEGLSNLKKILEKPE